MKSAILGASLLALACGSAAHAQGQSLPSFAEPALSPDGQTIAFVSGGDIWEVPAQGGTAHLVVSDAANEGRPFYSPDGTKLAFTSTRGGGNPNIYVLDLASARVTRITWAEVTEELNGWSPDGHWLYFSSAAKDIGRFTDVFRVPATGGTPVQLTRETYLPEFQAAASPDGQRLALLARGSMTAGQYWRNGHSNIDKTELWLKDLGQDGGYTQLVVPDAKQAWPMWSPDGSTITYMSDQDGTENLWQIGAAGGETRQLTRFTDGRLLFPQAAANGSGIVFERDFRIWRYDTASGTAAPVEIALRGAPAGPSTQNIALDSFDELAVAPDGKKVAIAGRGELFGLPTKDGTTERLTTSPGAENQATWSPDSRRMLYVGERGTQQLLFEYDLATRKETQLSSSGIAAAPVYSPDGKSAVYIRDRRELRHVTLPRTGVPAAERILYSGQIDPNWTSTPPVWSPNGQYVAFVHVDPKSFSNVFIVPAAGGAARQASFLANGQTAGMAWSPDGKYLLLSSGQRAEPQRIVRIDLLPHVPSFREDVFRNLFGPGEQPGTPAADKPAAERPAKDAAKPAAADAKPKVSPVRIAWEGLRQRATFLPLGMDAYSPQITSDGKTLVFVANNGGSQNLYSYNLDELASEPPRPKQISATPGPKGSFGLAADGKTLWFLDGGKVMTTPVPEASIKPLPARAELAVEFDREKQVVFDEAWTLLDTYFYDPKYHGVDWTAARAKWQPYITGARTPAELRRTIGLMIGELDASHSGIGSPNAVENNRVGDIGVSFDRTAYERDGALVVRELVPLGPAAVTGKIATGDRIVSVDGIDTAGRNFEQLLERKVGKQVALGVQSAAGLRSTVTLQPASDDVVTGLRYRGWVEERRALVERLSGGRLGYVHIADMGDASLDQLQIDLDAANQSKQGVVVDVRNNNGGYVHGRVLDILSRSNFLSMTQRGMTRFPARQALGQRALGLPTVVLANESTLSDGEDFMEGYRALGLGKMVGRDSAGWIIYTSNVPLIDGSLVRVPSLLIEGANGDNMELAGRKVDIDVQRPLGDTERGEDTQLAAGVRVLLDQLGGG